MIVSNGFMSTNIIQRNYSQMNVHGWVREVHKKQNSTMSDATQVAPIAITQIL